MDPVPLNAGLGEDIPQRAPEAQSPVADRKLRSPHAALFEVAQKSGPRLLGLAVAVLHCDELFGAVEPRPEHDQAAQSPVGAESHAGVYAVHPHVDVVPILRGRDS